MFVARCQTGWLCIMNRHISRARFLEIETEYGHAGPMIEEDKWFDDLRGFLREPP